MKRQGSQFFSQAVDSLDDVADMALKRRRRVGLVRVSLDKIGFDPMYKGGVGVSGHHVHEVASHCVAHRTLRQQYGQVDIVKIPDDRLAEIRELNRVRCESDPLMPRFSKDIEYVAGSRPHFVHALKLAKDGSRSLFNRGETPIKLQEGDIEGAFIIEEGPWCAIYESRLFSDAQVMQALASDDTMNERMEDFIEGKLQAFDHVHRVMAMMVSRQGGQQFTVKGMLTSLHMTRLGKISAADWARCMILYCELPPEMAKILQTCGNLACVLRVKVNVADFGLAAKLDYLAPWSMVAIMFSRFMDDRDHQPDLSGVSRTAILAKQMPCDIINELVAESAFVREVDAFIKAMILVYSRPSSHVNGGSSAHGLLDATCELLSSCGRYLLHVGMSLACAVKKATAKHEILGPEERLKILKVERAGTFRLMEVWFRSELVRNLIFASGDLPDWYNPMKVQDGAAGEALSQGRSPRVKEEPSAAAPSLYKTVAIAPSVGLSGPIADPTVLTRAHLFSRLGVKGCGEDVMAWIEPERACFEHTDECDGNCGLIVADTSEPSHERVFSRVRLIYVALPYAVVEVVGKKGNRKVDVHVDDLCHCAKILNPMFVREGGNPLDAYTYDVLEVFVSKACAEHTLLWAHLSTQQSCVEGVAVTRLSDKRFLPFTLQLRALRGFEKGALVLAPACGEVAQRSIEGDMARSKEATRAAWLAAKGSMLCKVPLQIMAAHKDRRRFEDDLKLTKKHFEDGSPLLVGEQLNNLPPFWALLRCVWPREEYDHDMEFDVGLNESSFQATGCKDEVGEGLRMLSNAFGCGIRKLSNLPKTFEFKVQLQIARNHEGRVMVECVQACLD